jgi:flagellar P-ring protein precursor FlgI
MAKYLLFIGIGLALAALGASQTPPAPTLPGRAPAAQATAQTPAPAAKDDAPPPQTPAQTAAARKAADQRKQVIARAEAEGVDVRIKDVAQFKGVTSNQLQGFGLVVGLNGTGDTQNMPMTSQLLANAGSQFTAENPSLLNPKNIAVVMVTAELPPFSSPGNRIDINVQSLGDASSLQGGYLLLTPLHGPQDPKTVFVTAMGPVSIGGFNVSKSGSSVQKNHTTTGRLPEMGIVVKRVPTTLVFDGHMYLQLDQEDFTTAQRLADQVNNEHPEYLATPIDAGNIDLTMPPGKNQVQAMSEIEEIRFFADTPATVVISENTGTVVMGGNVRIGPAVVAKGSLTVRIAQDNMISQPSPYSQGTTQAVSNAKIKTEEETAQVTEMGPTTSVSDLAVIFAALKISATDIIAILEALRDQGALKAVLKIQ